MNLLPMLALISGQSLLNAFIILVVCALILYVLWWGLGKLALGEPWTKIGTVLLVLATVIVCVNFLLSLIDKPFIRW